MSATCEILVDDPEGRIQRLQKPCGKPAVIHYDDKNWCNDCADPNVVRMYQFLREERGYVVIETAPNSPEVLECDEIIAALAPEEVTISPFSGKPLAECNDRERNAWVHGLLDSSRDMSMWKTGHYIQRYKDRKGGSLMHGIPHYTQGEWLPKLLESELWPVGIQLIKDDGYYDVVWPKKGWDCVSSCKQLGAAVVEAVIRVAWKKEGR